MNKFLHFIEGPEFDDDTVEKIYWFLHDFVLAFESHYYQQLRRKQLNDPPPTPELNFSEEDPF